MKCPKCGFNSFDHLESCKKCGGDLDGHKARFGLRGLFFRGRRLETSSTEPVFETRPELPFEEPAITGDSAALDFNFITEQENSVDDPSGSSPDTFLRDEPAAFSDLFSEVDFASEEDIRDEVTAEEYVVSLDEAEDGNTGSPPDVNLAELFLDSFEETVDGRDFTSGDFPPTEGLPPLENDLFELESLPLPEMTLAEAVPLTDTADRAGKEDAVSLASSNNPEEAMEDEALSCQGGDTVPSLMARLGAGVADLLILGLIFVLFLAAGEIALSQKKGSGIFPAAETLMELAIPYFLVLFAVSFGYFTLFHFLIGQTPGKMMFRLRVEGEQGEALLFSQAFLRSVGGLLSLLPAGLGYLGIALGRERRGWNDLLANSRVVRVEGWRGFDSKGEEGSPEEV